MGSTSFVVDEARSAAGYANEHCWYTDAALIAAGMVITVSRKSQRSKFSPKKQIDKYQHKICHLTDLL